MDIRLTNSTTENNEALINVDERVLANIVKDLVESAASSDFGRALSAVKNIATVPTATTIPPTQPIAEADVPKEIVAKATTEAKEEKKEYATVEKDGNNMNIEEIIANAKKEAKVEAENEISTRMIYFEISRMQKGDLIEMAQRWMDTRDTSKIERDITIRATKYNVECREAFDTEAQALNQLKAIKNDKFDRFLGILRDIAWICE